MPEIPRWDFCDWEFGVVKLEDEILANSSLKMWGKSSGRLNTGFVCGMMQQAICNHDMGRMRAGHQNLGKTLASEMAKSWSDLTSLMLLNSSLSEGQDFGCLVFSNRNWSFKEWRHPPRRFIKMDSWGCSRLLIAIGVGERIPYRLPHDKMLALCSKEEILKFAAFYMIPLPLN